VNLGDAQGYGLDLKGLIKMTEELKPLPCPFCGNNDLSFDFDTFGNFTNYQIGCKKCKIYARVCKVSSSNEAIKAWNTRVQSAVPSVEDIFKCLLNTKFPYGLPFYPNHGCSLFEVYPDLLKQATAIHALMKGEKNNDNAEEAV